MADGGVPYTIHGTKVMFPCKAYPTQLSMMDRIMKGLERHQHCLLESPTGSGKSLALLCSCLAWQAAEYEKSKSLKEEKKADESPCCDTPKPSSVPVQPAISPKVIDLTSSPAKQTPSQVNVKTEEPNTSVDESSGEDDFKSDSKRFRTPITYKSLNNGAVETPGTPINPPEWRMEITKTESPNTPSCHDNKSPPGSDGKKKTVEKITVPKIYFGTRTHKQVSQIARELGKTAYKHTKMCILSSREHSCIHPRVSKNANKNEECRKLLDPSIKGETCFYFQKPSSIGTQAGIKSRGLLTAWDIEDLVKVGKKARACPYYSARELMKEADIVFCPYNYLIDPKIRHQMDIDLKDEIIILDEAHNIEDSARESASLTIDTLDLQETLDDLNKMIQWNIMLTHYQSLHVMCASLMRWMNQMSSEGRMKDRGFEQAVLVLSGEEILNKLKDAGLTPASYTIYKNIFSEIMAADKDPANNYMKTSPSSRSVTILEGLFLVLGFLFGFNGQFVSDYRLTLLKTAHFVKNEMAGTWKRAGFGTRKEWKYSLNFWCFNPAVVFSRIGADARTIILTSGTLSPMSSFASELGVPFPIKLEANHVIANSQVWVGTLSVGPSGSPINATFRSAETYSFQDDIGNIVLDVCQKVPHGVLCFFPSYNMLDKVSKRWQSTGLWSKLLQKKLVLSEPRSGGKSDFDDIMHQFYQAIRRSEGEENLDCTDSDDEGCCSSEGALFLAVCRGKVSEGLDFADNNARAVITVGIPFPNTKDLKVDLKRKYNDMYVSKRGLLNGSEWYEIQAFRALNQALGRCIRHKQDWGAILLLDERFSKSPRYSNGISKWVRQRIYQYNDFKQAVNSLKEFTDARQLVPCPATQTPKSTATSRASTIVEGGFFPDTSPNKEDCGILNSACTPLKPKNDISLKTGTSLKGSTIFNQSAHGSPLLSANQLTGEWPSTPRSQLNSFNENCLQTPVSSVSQPRVTPPPTCVTSQQHSTQGVTLATNVTQFPPSLNHLTFANSATQGSVVRFPQVVQRAPLPTNAMQANVTQVHKVVPMATNVAQTPRLIFIPNNSNVTTVSPASGIRQKTPTPATRTQPVFYLTPVSINNQLATGQSPLGNSTTKVMLFTTPGNTPLHVNTQGNHVNTPLHVNTQGNHVHTPASHMITQGNHANTPNHVTAVVPNNQPFKQQNGVISQNVSNGSKGFVYPTGQTEAIKETRNRQINSSGISNVDGKTLSTSIQPRGSFSTLQSTSCPREHSTQGVAEETEVKMQTQNPPRSSQDDIRKPLDSALESKNECIVKSLSINEVEMLDIECPDSPDLFSTHEESAQTSSKDPGDADNMTTNQELETETSPCASVGNSIVNDGAVSRDLQPVIASPVKLETTGSKNTEESSMSAKKIRIDPSPSKLETLSSLSDGGALGDEAKEQPASESIVLQDQPAVRRNLRRTVRRATKETLNKCDAKNDTVVTREESSNVYCKQCNSLVYQGVIQQQNVKSQQLTSLYQKFCNQKTHLNKKRKRGTPSVDRAVWTTTDANLIPEATQALMQQGELFNALYVPKENTIYVPIQCCCCHTSSRVSSVIGVRVVLSDTNSKHQVWFFSETVVC